MRNLLCRPKKALHCLLSRIDRQQFSTSPHDLNVTDHSAHFHFLRPCKLDLGQRLKKKKLKIRLS